MASGSLEHEAQNRIMDNVIKCLCFSNDNIVLDRFFNSNIGYLNNKIVNPANFTYLCSTFSRNSFCRQQPLRVFHFTAVLAEKDSEFFTSLNEEHFYHFRIYNNL